MFLEMLVERIAGVLRDAAELFGPDGPKIGLKGKVSEDKKSEDLHRIAACREHVATVLGREYTCYKFSSMAGRLKCLLNERGGLAEEPFSRGNQRFDIDAWLHEGLDFRRIVFSLKVPDVLVSGELHHQILGALSQSDELGGMFAKGGVSMPEVMGPIDKTVSAVLRAAQESKTATIARIERANPAMIWT